MHKYFALIKNIRKNETEWIKEEFSDTFVEKKRLNFHLKQKQLTHIKQCFFESSRQRKTET